MDEDIDALRNRFGYHPPTSEEIKNNHQAVRGIMLHAAIELAEMVPYGRERSLMLTSLEEAMFWANAGIARLGNYNGVRVEGVVGDTPI